MNKIKMRIYAGVLLFLSAVFNNMMSVSDPENNINNIQEEADPRDNVNVQGLKEQLQNLLNNHIIEEISAELFIGNEDLYNRFEDFKQDCVSIINHFEVAGNNYLNQLIALVETLQQEWQPWYQNHENVFEETLFSAVVLSHKIIQELGLNDAIR